MNKQSENTSQSKTVTKKKNFFQQYWTVILLWFIIAGGIVLLLHFGVDKKLVAIITVTFGLFTKAFVGFGAIIALIPIVGPLIVNVFTIPFFWILNGLGYLVSVIAIKKGYSKDLVRSRVLTIALLVGVLLGYVLGNLIPIR